MGPQERERVLAGDAAKDSGLSRAERLLTVICSFKSYPACNGARVMNLSQVTVSDRLVLVTGVRVSGLYGAWYQEAYEPPLS